MTFLFYAAALVLVFALLGAALMRVDASRLAGGIRLAGPVAVGALGAVLLVAGRAGLGGMLVSLALGWYVSGQRRRAARPSRGRRSMVRSAALEMELDHDTGRLEGMVLAGRNEGRELSSLDLDDLRQLGRELAADAESLQLLEAYLDSRFPGWREDADPDMDGRQARAPASGPMTEQEAYEILGLESGASAADIRKAHRRLMQRFHPDLGGTSFLAARINEAKDVLLSAHK